MKKKYPYATVRQIKDLYKEGKSYAEISAAVKIPQGSVSTILARSGVTSRRITKRAVVGTNAVIRAILNSKVSDAEKLAIVDILVG